MSEISRRELLMETGSGRTDEVSKLKLRVDEMHILKAMTEMRGWKDIIVPYINKRFTIERFLQTKTPQERSEIWGALNELNQLIEFLRMKISDGEKAAQVMTEKNIR